MSSLARVVVCTGVESGVVTGGVPASESDSPVAPDVSFCSEVDSVGGVPGFGGVMVVGTFEELVAGGVRTLPPSPDPKTARPMTTAPRGSYREI